MPKPLLKAKTLVKKVWWNSKFASDRAVQQRVWGPLQRVGALTRMYAKRSIRRRASYKSRSLPGSPPYTHTSGRQGMKLITWDIDKGRKPNVIIGPWKFRTTANAGQRLTTPERHEHGGSDTGVVSVPTTETYWNRTMQLHIYKNELVRKNVRYKKRPFMRPAFNRVKRDFPHIFRAIY